ncbi:hypothetical protein O988_01115 [Pseudogymnoascus sp. VKM F-3808]|nr:hypothetical protein O988_01115 [Pseudogymnoascus sp. VKM F-3808]
MPPHNPEKVPFRPIMPSSSRERSEVSIHRRKHPKAERLSTRPSKLQRIPRSVTKNTCLNCKKARAKFDGRSHVAVATQIPKHYPATTKFISNMPKRSCRGKKTQELSAKDEMTGFSVKVLLADDQTSSDVLSALGYGDSHDRIVEWMDLVSAKEQTVLSPVDAAHSSEGSGHEDGDQESNLPWTYVTRNPTILDALFQVYFAWIHPVCTLFSERHFAQSYKTRNHQHCSVLLVNAMCALACHFHTPSEDHDEEYDHLGIRFAEAFRADFDAADDSITTIQAMAVMFLVDLADGSGLRASSYLKLASEKIAEFYSTTVDGPSLKNTIQGNGHK